MEHYIYITIYNVMIALQSNNDQHCTLWYAYIKAHLVSAHSPPTQPVLFLTMLYVLSLSLYIYIYRHTDSLVFLCTKATMVLTESPDGEQVAVAWVIEVEAAVEASYMLLLRKLSCLQLHVDQFLCSTM